MILLAANFREFSTRITIILGRQKLLAASYLLVSVVPPALIIFLDIPSYIMIPFSLIPGLFLSWLISGFLYSYNHSDFRRWQRIQQDFPQTFPGLRIAIAEFKSSDYQVRLLKKFRTESSFQTIDDETIAECQLFLRRQELNRRRILRLNLTRRMGNKVWQKHSLLSTEGIDELSRLIEQLRNVDSEQLIPPELQRSAG